MTRLHTKNYAKFMPRAALDLRRQVWVDQYAAGMSIRDIAAASGVRERVVYRAMLQVMSPVRSDKPAARARRRQVWAERHRVGWTIAAIARKWEAAWHTVAGALDQKVVRK